MVTPPALMAATPVGATTANRLDVCRTISLRNVVFPVPALPVRNTETPVSSTYLSAKVNLSSFSIIAPVVSVVCQWLPVEFNEIINFGLMPNNSRVIVTLPPLANPKRMLILSEWCLPRHKARCESARAFVPLKLALKVLTAKSDLYCGSANREIPWQSIR